MNITDEELCMLEQLCYIDGNIMTIIDGVERTSPKVSEKIRNVLSRNNSCTVEQFLNEMGFDEAGLKKLEELGSTQIDGACTGADEWVSAIRHLKTSKKLKNLVITGTMENTEKTTLAMCFTDGNPETEEAIVAFKGTSGDKEWIDNVEGLNTADTLYQKEALDFIQGLKYSDITVTGHSKGGNKAMYVAITSDKVKRCVAFDAQGFSDKFMKKYWAEIQMRAKNISNYSVATDYVHALMFQIPNSNQYYCLGYGIDNVLQHHSPISFFKMDENGELVLDENGNPILVQVPETEGIQMLHNFTCFIIDYAPDSDKGIIIQYVSQILAMTFAGDKVSTEELIDFALSDEDTLALILAYLVKYMDTYDLGAEDIDKLLETLGLNKLNELIKLKTFNIAGVGELSINLNLANILEIIKKNLTDKNDDWIIKNLLPLLKMCFFKDVDIDIKEFWTKINSNVKSINITQSTTIQQTGTGQIRDFSRMTYEIQMGVIEKIQNVVFPSVTSWSSYSSEEWYDPLGIPRAIKGINAYFAKLSEKNMESKGKIEKIFEEVAQADSKYAKNINEQNSNLKRIKENLLSISVNGS